MAASDGHPLDYYPEDETGDELVDSLALIDKAQAALARAQTLPEIGAVRDVAERLRRYARTAHLGRDAENRAARLRFDAERKGGGLLVTMPKQRPGEYQRSKKTTVAPSLADLGITKDQSSLWQRWARLSDEEFSTFIDEILSLRERLTQDEMAQRVRANRKAERVRAPLPTIDPSTIGAMIEVADACSMPLDDESVDLIVTSPPYGLDVDYEMGDIVADEWPEFMVRWLAEGLRVTRPSGRLALNIPLDTSEPTYRPTYAQSILAALAAGWAYRSTVVWNEGNTTKGGWALGSQASAARPHHVSQVEMIALFSRGEWAPSSDNVDDITPEEFLLAGRGPWTFGGETRPWEGHPAAFPLELPGRLIPYLSRVGDVVLDPFCGSGTTLLAAVERGRQAIGFDVSQVYVESARRRLFRP